MYEILNYINLSPPVKSRRLLPSDVTDPRAPLDGTTSLQGHLGGATYCVLEGDVAPVYDLLGIAYKPQWPYFLVVYDTIEYVLYLFLERYSSVDSLIESKKFPWLNVYFWLMWVSIHSHIRRVERRKKWASQITGKSKIQLYLHLCIWWSLPIFIASINVAAKCILIQKMNPY